MPSYELSAPPVYVLKDYTFYHEQSKLNELFPQDPPKELGEKAWDETVRIKDKSRGFLEGRLNLSLCFNRTYISGTFRRTQKSETVEWDKYVQGGQIGDSQFKPRGEPNPEFLNTIETLTDTVYPLIFSSKGEQRGLVLISGATSSGKSDLARGILYSYFRDLLSGRPAGGERRPHLVTCEDPIDTYWSVGPDEAASTGIDYTPRELRKDVQSLKMAVEDALRQTPKALFVGEVRQATDWAPLLRFASSGHLAVTTSHAGSLTETMGQVFRAAEATNPAQRSEVANQLLALVHLRVRSIPVAGGKPIKITIPAVWLRSLSSMKSLMAVGLSALLPNRGPLPGEDGCLGRTSFVEQLLSSGKVPPDSELAKQIRSIAFGWDLEGV